MSPFSDSCPIKLTVTGWDSTDANIDGEYVITEYQKRGFPVWLNADRDTYLWLQRDDYWSISSSYSFFGSTKDAYAKAYSPHGCPQGLDYEIPNYDESWESGSVEVKSAYGK